MNMLKRLTVAGLLSGSLLLPAIASAAPGPSGTLIGTVTCGADEITHAAHVQVAVEGLPLSTHTDATGKFTLSVPAAQTLTIAAVGGLDAFTVTSRPNVSVQPGQTLDIGNLDLAECSRPVADGDDDMTMEQRQDNHD